MKKIILMVITTQILTDLYPFQTLLLDIALTFAGKILCKDFDLYFDSFEAKSLVMKKIYKFGCSMCDKNNTK